MNDDIIKSMSEIVPKVFVSYSSQDWVAARLIVHVLEEHGIRCFFAERDLATGDPFDTAIVRRIWNSSLVIVLWSSRASQSQWVLQEVGIAVAQDIPVWPVAIEDIKFEGVILRNQGYYFRRSSDPYDQIARLAEEIKCAGKRPLVSSRPAIDRYLVGKLSRTEMLAKIMEEESQRADSTYTLRMQAAFSSFGISAAPEYRIDGYHTNEYHDLLIRELRAADQLARKASVKAIIWPLRPYEDKFKKYMRVRYNNLIQWLERNEDYHRVRFALGPYEDGNRYVFDSNVLVEGFKSPDLNTRGYQMTTVTNQGPAILAAIDSFDSRFNELWDEHARTCQVDPRKGAKEIRMYVINELKKLESQVR